MRMGAISGAASSLAQEASSRCRLALHRADESSALRGGGPLPIAAMGRCSAPPTRAGPTTAAVVNILNAVSLMARRVENCVYFEDPGGITFQVLTRNSRPQSDGLDRTM